MGRGGSLLLPAVAAMSSTTTTTTTTTDPSSSLSSSPVLATNRARQTTPQASNYSHIHRYHPHSASLIRLTPLEDDHPPSLTPYTAVNHTHTQAPTTATTTTTHPLDDPVTEPLLAHPPQQQHPDDQHLVNGVVHSQKQPLSSAPLASYVGLQPRLLDPDATTTTTTTTGTTTGQSHHASAKLKPTSSSSSSSSSSTTTTTFLRTRNNLRFLASAHLPPLRLLLSVALWFLSSLASLFLAKHILHTYHVNEAVFTLSQFASSLLFGLFFTKILRLHPLASLNITQLRAVFPLAAAFLIKEVLKYMSIARVSINLVNTIRSLGPLFSIAIERVAFRHTPPQAVILSILPTILGVILTSYDEMNATFATGMSFLVFLVGLAAAVVSTAINQSQNIYSKVLFGQERIDPVSLQIYLSAMSLAIIGPYTIIHSLFEYAVASSTGSSRFTFAPPSAHVAVILFAAGFVNFISSQLAFNTLSMISPVSYSVANTFKRVCSAVIAIAIFGERLSPVNGLGIAVSIAGVFAYEKASRDYKQAKMYRAMPKSPSTSDAALPNLFSSDAKEGRRFGAPLEDTVVGVGPVSHTELSSHNRGNAHLARHMVSRTAS